MQNDIFEGKKRLYVNMPVGSGKLITIAEFLHDTVKSNEKVLIICRFRAFADQVKDLLSQRLSPGQFECLPISDLSTQTSNDMILDEFQYILFDLNDFNNDKKAIKHILDNFSGITIGLFSGIPEEMDPFFKQRGEISYSLKYSEDCIEYVTQNLNIVKDFAGKSDKKLPYKKISESLIAYIKANKRLRILICNIACVKSPKTRTGQEVLIDLISIIAGLVPKIGVFAGLVMKYLAKLACNFVTKELSNALNCKECKISI